MAGVVSVFLVILLAAVLLVVADEEQNIYSKAKICPHRFHMGCILDVLEKSCTGLQAVQSCVEKGKCRNLDELERIVGALQPDNFEALNKCCCSKAFPEGYDDCKDPNPVCKMVISKHFNETDLGRNLQSLKKCLAEKKRSTCKVAVDASKWVRESLQKARGEMWHTEGCNILAPPEPLSDCGWDVKPQPRAIARADLYCDTIIWQFKEMGASDPFMAQCKDAPKMPEQKEDGEQDGDEEKDDDAEQDGDAGQEENGDNVDGDMDEAEEPQGEGEGEAWQEQEGVEEGEGDQPIEADGENDQAGKEDGEQEDGNGETMDEDNEEGLEEPLDMGDTLKKMKDDGGDGGDSEPKDVPQKPNKKDEL